MELLGPEIWPLGKALYSTPLVRCAFPPRITAGSSCESLTSWLLVGATRMRENVLTASYTRSSGC